MIKMRINKKITEDELDEARAWINGPIPHNEEGLIQDIKTGARLMDILLGAIEDLQAQVEDFQQAVDGAAEALIGDGVEFDPHAVGDELVPVVSKHLLEDMPHHTDSFKGLLSMLDSEADK